MALTRRRFNKSKRLISNTKCISKTKRINKKYKHINKTKRINKYRRSKNKRSNYKRSKNKRSNYYKKKYIGGGQILDDIIALNESLNDETSFNDNKEINKKGQERIIAFFEKVKKEKYYKDKRRVDAIRYSNIINKFNFDSNSSYSNNKFAIEEFQEKIEEIEKFIEKEENKVSSASVRGPTGSIGSTESKGSIGSTESKGSTESTRSASLRSLSSDSQQSSLTPSHGSQPQYPSLTASLTASHGSRSLSDPHGSRSLSVTHGSQHSFAPPSSSRKTSAFDYTGRKKYTIFTGFDLTITKNKSQFKYHIASNRTEIKENQDAIIKNFTEIKKMDSENINIIVVTSTICSYVDNAMKDPNKLILGEAQAIFKRDDNIFCRDDEVLAPTFVMNMIQQTLDTYFTHANHTNQLLEWIKENYTEEIQNTLFKEKEVKGNWKTVINLIPIDFKNWDKWGKYKMKYAKIYVENYFLTCLAYHKVYHITKYFDDNPDSSPENSLFIDYSQINCDIMRDFIEINQQYRGLTIIEAKVDYNRYTKNIVTGDYNDTFDKMKQFIREKKSSIDETHFEPLQGHFNPKGENYNTSDPFGEEDIE